MLSCQRYCFNKTSVFCYKALRNPKILKLPIYSCEPSQIPSRCNSNPCDCNNNAAGRPKKTASVVYKAYVPPAPQDHDYKNMALGRPMSPHLTIFGPTLTSMASIGERITGLITAMYAILLSGGTLFLSDGIDTYVAMLQSLELSRTTAFIAKVVIGLPFVYHYFNGLRFIAWNAGYLLNRDQIYGSAKQALIAGLVAAFLFAMF